MSSAYALPDGAAAWWAAVNTQPHRERIALENLERQGFSTYCPFVRRRRSHARRVDEVLRPLFPGYLFVNVRPDEECWRPILSTYGVRTLIRCGDRPSLVHARFIQALLAREVDGAVVRPPVPYRIGQQVQVVAGPCDGLVATILSLDEKDRITVLLELMSRQVKTELDSAQVMAL
jgi:transcription elongation factor/antiterminator RfaH